MKYIKYYDTNAAFENVVKPDGEGNVIPQISLIKNDKKPKYNITILGTVDDANATFDLYVNASAKTNYLSCALAPTFEGKKFKAVLPNYYNYTYRLFDGSSNANVKNHLKTIERVDGIEHCSSLWSAFQQCWKLEKLNSNDWDTSKITSLKYAFVGCSGLTSLDVSGWNTSNVTDMSYCFANALSLNALDVSNWNTSKVTTLESVFYKCSGLKSIDVSKWNTKKSY